MLKYLIIFFDNYSMNFNKIAVTKFNDCKIIHLYTLAYIMFRDKPG